MPRGSRRDRGALIALGLVLSAIVFIALSQSIIDASVVSSHTVDHNQEPDSANGEDNAGYSVTWVLASGIGQVLNAAAPVIAAIASAFIGYFTFTLYRSTNQLWRASTRQAAISRAAIRASDREAEMRLRAYVSVDYAELLDPPDRVGFSAQIVFTNFGQTPAYDVVVRCRSTTIRPEGIMPQMISYADIETTEPVVRGPKSSMAKGIHTILEEDELTAIQKEEFVIWIYGDLKYRDAFNRWRTTEFCLRVWRFGQPSQRIGPCDFGNSAD